MGAGMEQSSEKGRLVVLKEGMGQRKGGNSMHAGEFGLRHGVVHWHARKPP
jgi:hypothetical protein